MVTLYKRCIDILHDCQLYVDLEMSNDQTRVGVWPNVDIMPIPFVRLSRPVHVSAAYLTAEAQELRQLADLLWRRKALAAIAAVLGDQNVTRQRLAVMLIDDGVQQSAAMYASALPPRARRDRLACSLHGADHTSGLTKTQSRQMSLKESLDWVLMIRTLARVNFDRTLEQSLVELGSNMRTYRRVINRLKPHLVGLRGPIAPRRLLAALLVRIATCRDSISAPE